MARYTRQRGGGGAPPFITSSTIVLRITDGVGKITPAGFKAQLRGSVELVLAGTQLASSFDKLLEERGREAYQQVVAKVKPPPKMGTKTAIFFDGTKWVESRCYDAERVNDLMSVLDYDIDDDESWNKGQKDLFGVEVLSDGTPTSQNQTSTVLNGRLVVVNAVATATKAGGVKVLCSFEACDEERLKALRAQVSEAAKVAASTRDDDDIPF